MKIGEKRGFEHPFEQYSKYTTGIQWYMYHLVHISSSKAFSFVSQQDDLCLKGENFPWTFREILLRLSEKNRYSSEKQI